MVKHTTGSKKEIHDVEHAVNHYPEYFNRPSELLPIASLKRADKIRLLRQWKYDVQLQEVAEEENMRSPKPDILDEIQSVLSSLGASEDRDDSPPTKTGGLF